MAPTRPQRLRVSHYDIDKMNDDESLELLIQQGKNKRDIEIFDKKEESKAKKRRGM